MHYSRLLRSGQTDPIRLGPVDRFWSQVTRTDGCWIWTGTGIEANGYARIKVNGERILVHRMSWVMAFGSVPSGLVVCHRCDVPLCVNPDHLFVGTQKDNIADMMAKGRWRGGRR